MKSPDLSNVAPAQCPATLDKDNSLAETKATPVVGIATTSETPMAKNTRTLSKNPGRTIRRITSVASAWENLASGETFAGMTLCEFKQAIEPSFAARERIAALETAMIAAVQSRTQADAQSHALTSSVIFSVLASPDARISEGLYRAMGFIPETERASGLTRKKPRRVSSSANA
jgi:hypothetical protein